MSEYGLYPGEARYAQGEQLIRKTLRDHPLTELETAMLAEHLDLVRAPGDSRAFRDQWRVIVDWLESTGRISPRENKALKKMGGVDA